MGVGGNVIRVMSDVNKLPNMDAYTILYQVKNFIKNPFLMEEVFSQINTKDKNNSDVEELAEVTLANVISLIHSEYPPNVSKRLHRYYINNKEALATSVMADLNQEVLSK